MLPREILTETWDEQSVRVVLRRPVRPDCDRAEPIPRWSISSPRGLLAAKNPILITGYARPRCRGFGRDREAVALRRHSRYRLSDRSPTSGRSFPHFGGFQADNLADVDVGLLVDVDVPWIPVATRDNPSTFWAQIDVDVLKSASPMWSFPANLRIQGRSSRILTQLTERHQRIGDAGFPQRPPASEFERLTAEQKERLQRDRRAGRRQGTGRRDQPALCLRRDRQGDRAGRHRA